MSRYTMHFEWAEGASKREARPHDLESETLDQAKVKAAIIYAGASFQRVPPQAYRIEGPRGEIVYRFPEKRAAVR